MNNKILFSFALVACMALMGSGAFAMTVDYQPYYNTYGTGLFSAVLVGQPIDASSAGFSIDFYSNTSKVITLDSPDETNQYWWVWVNLHNSGENTTSQIVLAPHDQRVFIQCSGSGGWFNLTSGYSNNTWNNGYALFKLTWDTEVSIPVADSSNGMFDTPTGLPLYIKQRDCVFNADSNDFAGGDWVTMYVWAQNPDKNAVCGVDASVQYLQTATVTIVDINLQIWQIMFQLFSIVVIIGAIFGIPLFLIKMIRFMIEEIRGKRKLF